ncbi:hypothetical protein O181_052273 [Austropuccinia psidii MF-1]|uniref:Uncharacterized protein n=1 Tax=Austropuccinia psidii MF-1 TaxID=1389203 RepID=A0A9Q3HP68_9BASI|nr:hypothetical protein [Austropuccinia psidii MF-1]
MASNVAPRSLNDSNSNNLSNKLKIIEEATKARDNAQDNAQDKAQDHVQDNIILSIQTIETIRDFAKDIKPLNIDGTNLFDWVADLDHTLYYLFDLEENYLQSIQPITLNKNLDKIAKILIYWTIPRELRTYIKDTKHAHDAYNALSNQFNQNNRTSHMASLVELFNFHFHITQPEHVTLLYDKLHRQFNQLIYSGFKLDHDTLLGAFFQIAVGRSNFEIYNSISKSLDDRPNSQVNHPSSKEIAAIARLHFENLMRSTVALEDSTPILPSNSIPSSTFDNSNTHDIIARALSNLKLPTEISNEIINSASKILPQKLSITNPETQSLLKLTPQKNPIPSKSHIDNSNQTQNSPSQSISTSLKNLNSSSDLQKSQSTVAISNSTPNLVEPIPQAGVSSSSTFAPSPSPTKSSSKNTHPIPSTSLSAS